MYEYRAIVLKVIDGDTIDVDIDLGFGVWLKNQRIRFYGIDTPESRTSDLEEKQFGLLAKEFVEKHCQVGSNIVIKSHLDDRGKYGRILGEIIINDKSVILNEVMVVKKLAVRYYGQSKDDIKEEHLKNREHLLKSGMLS